MLSDQYLEELLQEALSGEPTSEIMLVKRMQMLQAERGEAVLQESNELTCQLYKLLCQMKKAGRVVLSHGCCERRCWNWANTPQQLVHSESRVQT